MCMGSKPKPPKLPPLAKPPTAPDAPANPLLGDAATKKRNAGQPTSSSRSPLRIDLDIPGASGITLPI